MKDNEKEFSGDRIIEYLNYLKEYSQDISNQRTIYRKRFKDINKEVDLFLKLLKDNKISDEKFLKQVRELKFHCNPIRDFFIDYISYLKGKMKSTKHFTPYDDIKEGAKEQNQILRNELNKFIAKVDTILDNIQKNQTFRAWNNSRFRYKRWIPILFFYQFLILFTQKINFSIKNY